MSVTTCECGLLYCPDLANDRRRHKKEHDEWANGVQGTVLGAQIGSHGEYRLTIVPPTAPARLREVSGRLGRIGNRETHYDFGVYQYKYPKALREHGVHAALAWHDDRAIGILIFDRRTEEVFMGWDDAPGTTYRVSPANPRWSVTYAWVHPGHRRKGLASSLLHAAAGFCRVAVADLGLLGPFTDGGEALVRKHFPEGFWRI